MSLPSDYMPMRQVDGCVSFGRMVIGDRHSEVLVQHRRATSGCACNQSHLFSNSWKVKS